MREGDPEPQNEPSGLDRTLNRILYSESWNHAGDADV